MGETDNLTREKLREWQIRRLEIKDRMQLHPEMTLELSKVLDLMDEEHAAILSGSKGDQAEGLHHQDATLGRTAPAEHSPRPIAAKFYLQLHVAAHSPEDLCRLLEMSVYELQGQIDANGAVVMGEHRKYPGGMSGTMGNYHFELGVNGEGSHG